MILVSTGCYNTKKKQWAHKVDDIESIKKKQHSFKGFEVDLIYSEYQNKLFVCHELEDTIKNLTFENWLSAIDKPQRLKYWLDMKFLEVNNAEATVQLLKEITSQFNIEQNIIVESYNNIALKTLKDNKIPVLFWVDDMTYWEVKDTVRWKKHVTEKLRILQPDGISGSMNSFPLLSNTFPQNKVYYWNTPIYDSADNIKTSNEMARRPNVSVVLVDYDKPTN